MKQYTRRNFLTYWRNHSAIAPSPIEHSDTPPNDTPLSNRPHPPRHIHPTLPQQQKHVVRAPAGAVNAASVVAPIPNTTESGIREIVFSFDDGPSLVATSSILDTLARYQIQTIFFVLGQKLASRAGRELMIRAHSEGHIIANHTYSHPNLTTLDAEGIREELRRAEEQIGEYLSPSRLMRPPYGAINDTVRQVLDEEGYTALLWTTASLDWQFQSAEWVDYTIDAIQNGPQHNHVLMHDTYSWTADNLERFIRLVQALPNTRIVSFF